MMNKKHKLLYLVVGASLLASGYFAYQAHERDKRLTTAQLLNEELELFKRKQQQLLTIDSLLVQGNYDEAIQSYEKTLGTAHELQLGVPLRIAMAHRLKDSKKIVTTGAQAMNGQVDSTALKTVGSTLLRAMDSLQFALDKSKVQLQNLRGQIRERSMGAYLRFKSDKGTPLHYVGEVKNGKANGTGIALLDSGSRYEGEWAENKRHGAGTFYWPDGEKYTGNYTDDMRNGLGTYYWPNGEKYTGQWKADKRNGRGTFYAKDGTVVTQGIWKNDKLQEPDKKNRKP